MSPRRPNGEGSIYRRNSDGIWTGMLDITQPGDPVRRRKPIYGKSRGEVQRKLATLRRQYLETGQLPSANLTVAAWMRTWLDDIAAERLRPSTMTSHRQKVELYIVPRLGKHRLDKLSPDHIRAMYRWMADERGLSMNTRRQTHAILSRALTVAVREGKVTRNAAQMMDGPPPQTTEVDALNPTEIAALIEAMAGDRMESRWLAALHLGLRQGEALALAWEQVDLDGGTLSVVRALTRVPRRGLVMGPPKSKKGTRTVPLTEPLAASLARRREAWDLERQEPGYTDLGLVWAQRSGRPMDPAKDWQAWKDLLAKAEVRDVRLHDARHAAATALGALGVPLPVMGAILGHAQVTTTMLYTHTDLTAMREAISRLDRKAIEP